MAHLYVSSQEGLLCLPTQSQDCGGCSRRFTPSTCDKVSGDTLVNNMPVTSSNMICLYWVSVGLGRHILWRSDLNMLASTTLIAVWYGDKRPCVKLSHGLSRSSRCPDPGLWEDQTGCNPASHYEHDLQDPMSALSVPLIFFEHCIYSVFFKKRTVRKLLSL